MANELGQPTAQEIAEKFCTEMLCNALLCEGCPVNEIIKAAQQRVQSDEFCSCLTRNVTVDTRTNIATCRCCGKTRR